MLKTMPNPFGALAICLGIGTAGGPVTQAQAPSHTAAQAIVEGTCQDCHNDRVETLEAPTTGVRVGALRGVDTCFEGHGEALERRLVRAVEAGRRHHPGP